MQGEGADEQLVAYETQHVKIETGFYPFDQVQLAMCLPDY